MLKISFRKEFQSHRSIITGVDTWFILQTASNVWEYWLTFHTEVNSCSATPTVTL